MKIFDGDFLHLWSFLRPYRWRVVKGSLFVLINSAVGMVFPFLLKLLIDSQSANGVKNFSATELLIGMILLVVIQAVVNYWRLYHVILIGDNLMADLRTSIFSHIVKLPLEFFNQNRVGELVSRIQNDVALIQESVSIALTDMLRNIGTLAIATTLAFTLSIELASLILILLPAIAIAARFFNKGIHDNSRELQDKVAESNIILGEVFGAISNVKTFTNEWYEVERFRQNMNQVVATARKSAHVRSMLGSALFLIVFGAIILIAWRGMSLMRQGVISYGDLLAFVIYAVYITSSLNGMADLLSRVQRSLGATQRISELLRLPTEQVEKIESGLDPDQIIDGSLEIKDLSFSYPTNRSQHALRDITLKVEAGERVAVVGPSGAGKSTLLAMLSMLYKPDEGVVLFGKRDSADFPLSALRSQFAIVPQDLQLFGGTVKENIIYGNLMASMDQVIQAAREACAHEFISALPDGYMTVVGDRGTRLSGGQRQRIAIARAILRDPKILILDEATSALDTESEFLVQTALTNLMKFRTSFVVAHRLSTVYGADRIVVLQNGSIVEIGSHQQLMDTDQGLYKRLMEFQLA
ncbi:ABC transporter ATP-binding protein [Dyadobacter sp. OTU695]|uniref:ABC transporter ATP-binding protein n=1 Tax=Dyadobacter sp. OTU695 TaxID=3043860 RepID=UPI00313ADE21